MELSASKCDTFLDQWRKKKETETESCVSFQAQKNSSDFGKQS